jgi:hypothetical protein
MTLGRKARAIPASQLSLDQDNKEGVHLVGVPAPATVYSVCVWGGGGAKPCRLAL